jgi:hypothetical protein
VPVPFVKVPGTIIVGLCREGCNSDSTTSSPSLLFFPTGGNRVRIYVEKTVNRKPLSMIGPFDTYAQAQAFMRRARVEEDRHQHARDAKEMEWYTNVEYSILTTDN